jgi:hypothetical protein
MIQALGCRERSHRRASMPQLRDVSVHTPSKKLSTLTVPAVPRLLWWGCWLEICITPGTEIAMRACRLKSQPSIDSLQQRSRYGFDGACFVYILLSNIFLIDRDLGGHVRLLARDRHYCSSAHAEMLVLQFAARRKRAASRSCTMR